MRLQALFGGLALLSVIAIWRHPFDDSHAARRGGVSICAVGGPHGLCDAVAGLSAALHDPILQMDRGGILPPKDTPGAIDTAITQANIDATVCRPGYARAARPSFAVTNPFKRRLMLAHHPGERMADYELDHLIPISIGGAPFDARDLWLQRRRGPANAADKNVLAYVLWRLVCEHRLPLRTAQHAIGQDWVAAYRSFATPENVARYQFGHFARERG